MDLDSGLLLFDGRLRLTIAFCLPLTDFKSRSLDLDSSLMLLAGRLRLIMAFCLPYVDVVDVGIVDNSRSLDLDSSLMLLVGSSSNDAGKNDARIYARIVPSQQKVS